LLVACWFVAVAAVAFGLSLLYRFQDT